MSYNLSFMNTSNTLYDVVTATNDLTNNFLMTGLLIVVFIGLLAFYLSKNNDFGKSLIMTGFTTTIISGLLFFADLLAWYIAVLPLVVLIVALIADFFT